jgi:hypothetical protein
MFFGEQNYPESFAEPAFEVLECHFDILEVAIKTSQQ